MSFIELIKKAESQEIKIKRQGEIICQQLERIELLEAELKAVLYRKV